MDEAIGKTGPAPDHISNLLGGNGSSGFQVFSLGAGKAVAGARVPLVLPVPNVMIGYSAAELRVPFRNLPASVSGRVLLERTVGFGSQLFHQPHEHGQGPCHTHSACQVGVPLVFQCPM